MAITAAQRNIALTQILVSAIEAAGAPSVLPLSQLLPGVTPAVVLSTLITALGTSEDATFTLALSNMVAAANAASVSSVSTEASSIAVDQANITAWTVQ